MIWKFLKQNDLFLKGLNWVQHWVSRIGLWGKQVKKIRKCKKWLSSLFILDDKKYRTFHVKDDYGKLWLEMHDATFLNAAATVDVLAANNDLISVETTAGHFAWL